MAMACENEKKCFTVIWRIENVSYSMADSSKVLSSPAFRVDEIHETSWKLELDFDHGEIGVFSRRLDEKRVEDIKVMFEFAFMLADGTVSHEFEDTYTNEDLSAGTSNFSWLHEVFGKRNPLFLPEDTLTIRCKIWKSEGEMRKNVQYFARTCISVEKRSFLWNIEDFVNLNPDRKQTYEIKSLGSDKKLMSLELFFTGGIIYEQAIRFRIIPCRQNAKNCNIQVSIVDSSNNTVKCFQDEFLVRDSCKSKDFTLFFTKRELIEKKHIYLPNDALSLLCECTFSLGIAHEEIEQVNCDCMLFEGKIPSSCHLPKENDLPVPKSILIDNLKSMLNDSCLSDVKLKTESQIYPAHKFILASQSPVFKAMFSTDMSENINDCVYIEDLNDDTVSRLLQYIYSAEVGQLEWDIAIQLYEAADKYQILSLKDICSFYLKNNLCPDNACELLILANRHHDNDFKFFVQDFILRHAMLIMNSEAWDQLMETDCKLAAETMHLRYKM